MQLALSVTLVNSIIGNNDMVVSNGDLTHFGESYNTIGCIRYDVNFLLFSAVQFVAL